uniref:NADH-ubiquinone oxidoreductase chain 3 n=1 Tax=Goeldia sp. DPP-2018 TaxID=2136113 RepID=A0A2U8XCA0_9ARAC|nr:NADH dehydrogenase subunit 3 [Goeldia sp. DPP-2018]
MEVFILMIFIFFVFVLLFYKSKMIFEEMTMYECGFNSMMGVRIPFSYRFFLISILFVIFDVEVSLLLPIPYMKLVEMSMWVFLLFVLILIIGLLYEYYYGSLEWLSNFVSKA